MGLQSTKGGPCIEGLGNNLGVQAPLLGFRSPRKGVALGVRRGRELTFSTAGPPKSNQEWKADRGW